MATKKTSKAKKQKAIRRADGTFAPGVIQPGARPFPPGASGNLNGRGHSLGLTAQLKKLLAEPTQDGERTKGARLMELGLIAAQAGDFRFWKEILDRVEGKVPNEQHIFEHRREEVLIGVVSIVAEAVLLETSDAELAQRIADRAMLLNQGGGR